MIGWTLEIPGVVRQARVLPAKEWMAQMSNGNVGWQGRETKSWLWRAILAPSVALVSVGLVLFGAEEAAAQDSPAPAATGLAPTIPVPRATDPGVTPALNQEKPNLAAPAVSANSSSLPTDHEVVIGAWGLGYLGSARVQLPLAIPVGRGDQAGMSPNDKLNLRQLLVPTLGLRKWFSKRRGFEAGLGLSMSTGGNSATYGDAKSTVDKESIFAASVHIGVPMVVVDTRHMAFLVAPEAKLTLAASNIAANYEDNAPPDAKMRGGAVDVGLRAGAEMHFGFMGLPRLSLQAGVAVYVTAQWASATVSNQSLSTYDVSVGFGSAGNPWDIFTGIANLSARYYF